MSSGRAALLLAISAVLLGCVSAGPERLSVEPPRVPDRVRAEQRAIYEDALRRYRGYAERLLRVGDPLQEGSPDLCGDAPRVPRVGLSVLGPDEVAGWASLPSLRNALRAAAAEVLGVREGVTVVAVAQGSPAEQIGIRPGDRVLRVDGTEVATVRDYHEALRNATPEAPVHLALRREGASLEAVLGWRPGCDVPVFLVVNDSPAVVLHERTITLTSGMLDFADSDDALAFVLAVNAAHHLLGHDPGDRRRRQPEADYLGCYLVARGGFDLRAGPDLYTRWSRRAPMQIVEDAVGPGSLDRVGLLGAAIAEIEAKQAAGEPLVPERSR